MGHILSREPFVSSIPTETNFRSIVPSRSPYAGVGHRKNDRFVTVLTSRAAFKRMIAQNTHGSPSQLNQVTGSLEVGMPSCMAKLFDWYYDLG